MRYPKQTIPVRLGSPVTQISLAGSLIKDWNMKEKEIDAILKFAEKLNEKGEETAALYVLLVLSDMIVEDK